ncbi:hypothetical protein AGDE_05188 [Angomonas deanei]|nr:hypothetical protein AGDE_05188 [Angomonas deanei]|eukprot:EPY38741.1 hypothetical protein AGDE_05188 [Angomonas deanei]
MKKKGFDPDDVLNYNGSEAHPLAKWSTKSFPSAYKYKDALEEMEKSNSKPWGLLKARINFSDGKFELYERTNAADPGSLHLAKTYDPNGQFRKETMNRTMQGRSELKPKLQHTADDRGHHLGDKPIPRSFAPEVLYKDYPPPVTSQAGYDFTPVSYNSYMVRPKEDLQGTRDLKSNFMQNSTDYRPRSYKREDPRSRHCHCAEVFQVGDYTLDLAHQTDTTDHRNRTTQRNFNATGDRKHESYIVGKRDVQQPTFRATIKGNTANGAAPLQDSEVPADVPQ